MNAVGGSTTNVALLTQLMVGKPAEQQTDNALKMVRVDAAQQAQAAKLEGYGQILDVLV